MKDIYCICGYLTKVPAFAKHKNFYKCVQKHDKILSTFTKANINKCITKEKSILRTLSSKAPEETALNRFDKRWLFVCFD